jgi:hypothetical protein
MNSPRICISILLSLGFAVSESAWAAPRLVNENGEFPTTIEDQIGGRAERLVLTGTAVRKKLGVALYRIAGYCDDDLQLKDVDALAAADVPKRLVLVMQRDIADWVLRRGFAEAFEANDPDGRFADHSRKLLDFLTAASVKEGDAIVLTHVPGSGVDCRLGDKPPLAIEDREFAHIVWKVFMGPKAVTPELRKGLGARLTPPAKK